MSLPPPPAPSLTMMPSTMPRLTPPALVNPYAVYGCCVSAPLPPTSIRPMDTAGACASTAQKSRAPGRLASLSASKCVVTLVACRSTTGDAPLTVIVSAIEPGVSSVLTVAVKPRATLIPDRVTGPNPDSSNVNVYSPGPSDGNRYAPSASVIAVRAPIAAAPDKVTVTPGSTAFVLSVTVPLIAPVVELTVCAVAAVARASTTIATAAARK